MDANRHLVEPDAVYKVAMALLPGITAEMVRGFAGSGITCRDFFTLDFAELSGHLGRSASLTHLVTNRVEALARARRELDFITRHSVRTLFILDEDYPVLLRETPDAPVMLFILGRVCLDVSPSLAMVGTRRCTAYGSAFCDKFVTEIAGYYPEALIISGLAYGIDAASHSAALQNGLATVAVLAHGLDTIYPAPHRNLAREIVRAGGGLVTEFPTGTKPYRGNFLQRNRIVAGLSELTFVVESEVKGGAMSTANVAFSYDREVYALPGRYTDTASSGTNMLVARGKAHIYTTVGDLMNHMGWKIQSFHDITPPRRNLFPELDGDAAKVYALLHDGKRPFAIDEIHLSTRLPVSQLLSVLTELEFEGIVIKLPGARYEAQ